VSVTGHAAEGAYVRLNPVNHTSGLFDYTEDEQWLAAGYLLVGMILERSTGQSVHDLFAERIIRPLGLRHTYYAAGSTFTFLSTENGHCRRRPPVSRRGGHPVRSRAD
jgi:Beta-lactamase